MTIIYSVIIPTLNQSRKLNICLEHLSYLHFPQDAFEVLVIDNGSTDDTKKITSSYDNRIPNLRYDYCAEPGLMAARHMGADNAKGEILCYLDDDSLVTENWMYGLDKAYKNEDVVIVGGPCIPKYEVVPPDWVEYFWKSDGNGRWHGYLSLLDYGDHEQLIHPIYIFGCNYSIRKKIFFDYGGTCPDYYPDQYKQYQGDGESALSLKIYGSGLKAIYNPNVKINHLIPDTRLTFEYFCRRRFFNGIHGSYRTIRQQYGLDNYSSEKDITASIKRFFGPVYRNYKKTRRSFYLLRQKLSLLLTPTKLRYQKEDCEEPEAIIHMQSKLEQCYREGYNYHQKEFDRDPKLHKWVLRNNYLGVNGRLPFSEHVSSIK